METENILITSESESRSVVSNTLLLCGLYSSWNSLGQNTGMGSLSLLQGFFPTQGLNLGLQHCRQILYQLNHKRSPRILKWVACPFTRGSSDTGMELRSPALQADSLPLIYERNPLITIVGFIYTLFPISHAPLNAYGTYHFH